MNDPKKYHSMKYRIYFVGLGLDIFILLGMFFSGLTFYVRDVSSLVSGSPFVAVTVYFSIISMVFLAVHLPLDFFIGYYWEHQFGLSTQNIKEWFVDQIKKGILSYVVFLVIIEGAYFFLSQCEQSWWFWTGLVWVGGSIFLAKITPSMIIPLFYKYGEVEDRELRERIARLFESCRMSLKSLSSINFSSKTKKANAFLCGLGKGKKVVLSDTLLSLFTSGEIEAVVAHELGHHCHRDILKLLAVNSFLVFGGLFIVDKLIRLSAGQYLANGIADVALFPLFALYLLLFAVLCAPLLNAYSRKVERAADRFALKLTKDNESFVSLMRKLAELNLAVESPGRFIEIMFYDHPPVEQRIQFAKNFKE